MMSEKSQAKLSMIAEVAQLLPSTKQWMVQRGYLKRCFEDGEMVYEITVKGWEYLELCKGRKS